MRKITLSILSLLLLNLAFSQSYDPNVAFEMLRASSAAYCSSPQLQNMQCGDVCNDLSGYQYEFVLQNTFNFSLVESVSYSMFVNPTANIFVTAFRGTDNIPQLINEFLSSKAVSYTLNNISNAVATQYFYYNYQTYLRDSFMTNFQSAVQNYSGYNFYVVGHSLGGAFANLAVLDIAYNNLVPTSQVYLYTYGAPRTGDVNLAQAVVNSVNQLYRITHYKDPVPHVPTCVVNLEGVCQSWQDHPSENNFLLYNAWHTWPEVFYVAEDTPDYIICQQGENTTCSDQYPLSATNVSDHLFYLGVNTSCLNNGPIVDESDATVNTDTESEFFAYLSY